MSGAHPASAPAAGEAVDTSAFPDERMHELLATTRPYTAMLLRLGVGAAAPGAEAHVWEHGRRNLALRTAGTMLLVLPAPGHDEWAGIAVFAAPAEQVERLLADDPAIRAGVFTYELVPVIGFPGATLP